mmetsp:Transcript_46043/g.115931  ORF Transcript_46043/g.115931 Transcript_46043/m.115931 type:complete len:245 (+) Transcript_46043:199-933(+)
MLVIALWLRSRTSMEVSARIDSVRSPSIPVLDAYKWVREESMVSPSRDVMPSAVFPFRKRTVREYAIGDMSGRAARLLYAKYSCEHDCRQSNTDGKSARQLPNTFTVVRLASALSWLGRAARRLSPSSSSRSSTRLDTSGGMSVRRLDVNSSTCRDVTYHSSAGRTDRRLLRTRSSVRRGSSSSENSVSGRLASMLWFKLMSSSRFSFSKEFGSVCSSLWLRFMRVRADRLERVPLSKLISSFF